MSSESLVMLRRLSLAIRARKWKLAYAYADALDALLIADKYRRPNP